MSTFSLIAQDESHVVMNTLTILELDVITFLVTEQPAIKQNIFSLTTCRTNDVTKTTLIVSMMSILWENVEA